MAKLEDGPGFYGGNPAREQLQGSRRTGLRSVVGIRKFIRQDEDNRQSKAEPVKLGIWRG